MECAVGLPNPNFGYLAFLLWLGRDFGAVMPIAPDDFDLIVFDSNDPIPLPYLLAGLDDFAANGPPAQLGEVKLGVPRNAALGSAKAARRF